ncbi:MAG: type II secretion system F family protein [Candidatus Diapherotrites archaeon]|nr:type II secretion system F family protein [Candidatus Diapherotrites archaeon]
MEKDVDLDELKKAIVGDSEGKSKSPAPSRAAEKKTIESVDEIVQRIEEKYKEEGAYIRRENAEPEIDINKVLSPEITVSGNPSDLAESDSGFVRFAGKLYLKFKGFFDKLAGSFANSDYLKKLDWDLYAAGLPFTGSQYLILTLVSATVLALIAFIASVPLFLTKGNPVLAAIGPITVAFLTFVLVYVFARMHPATIAANRSRAAERYLPFALRHLAVEIRAGMGLYQAMRAVAAANYGELSEEFKRTLREIDEGKPMEVALSNLAARSKSRGMRRAVASILRAVRIGGNLSDTIMNIAKDVSFEQRQKVAAYSEKLNFFGVLFMFVGVVFPVMLAMLTTIGYAPTSGKLLAAFRFPPALLMVAFLIGFPGILLLFYMFVRMSDPMR